MDSNQTRHVLIVEDDQRLAELTREYLVSNGLTVDVEHNGAVAVARIKAEQPYLVILDLMLPGEDGLGICRLVRPEYSGPIIMLTARTDELDQVVGLEVGADDYICKPFSPREMVARVKAVLRRSLLHTTNIANQSLQLDANSFRVLAEGHEIELTSVEFQLFQALHQQPGRIFSRSKLMDLIYSDQRVVSDRTIDSHIKKLRKKLDELLPNQELVHSVYGAGYRYEPPK